MSLIHQPSWPAPTDSVATKTSEEQAQVETVIHDLFLPFLTSSDGEAGLPPPSLARLTHISFLKKGLQPLPAGYVGFDSTRPWLVYWATHAAYLLAMPFAEDVRQRAVSTLLSCQSPQGGFAGGPGQMPHLMATYAAVCALAINGAPVPAPGLKDAKEDVGKGGWDAIDRPALYSFLCSLKLPDGSFTVHAGGEVDVRATYCVVCISLLCGIATPELLRGCDAFVASCQTYEGGLAASSQPTYKSTSSSGPVLDTSIARPAIGEAHGGYAFCALASHLALSQLDQSLLSTASPSASASGPAVSVVPGSEQLNLSALLRWATSQQGTAYEGGGFRGRTNKLVDGCYGWFSGGGMFACLQVAMELERGEWWSEAEDKTVYAEKEGDREEDWESDDDPLSFKPDSFLFDRAALQEYVLVAAQEATGGLRDKPGKRPDLYHTCYNLSGMSLSQHRLRLDADGRDALAAAYKAARDEQEQEREWRKRCYASSLGWTAVADKTLIVGDQSKNFLVPTHPIFNIPFPCAKAMLDWAYAQ